MPKTKKIKINNILGGRSATAYLSGEQQFSGSVAIDPDYPLSSTYPKTSGIAFPTRYEKFSGVNVNDEVIAIVTTPKNTNIYVVLANGKLISYSSALGSETLIGTVSGNLAKGAWYYNNYIYISAGTDVSRYGPLDGTPSLTDSVWTGATLGTLTALTNTTYPTLRSVLIPNHWGCVHGDGSSYFLDFINGQGLVHRINTKKVTAEGDTNGTTVASAYNVLDLPFGFYPTAITSFSTDLAILAIQSPSATATRDKAALFLWDPTNTDTFYRGPIYLTDPLATAMQYINGKLYIFSGNGVDGVRVSVYAGGDTIKDVGFMEEGMPPLAGAVDSWGERVAWGAYATYPATCACVYTMGSKDARLPLGIHNVVKATSAGTTPFTTALKFIAPAAGSQPAFLVASNDGTGAQIDKTSSSATYAAVYDSPVIQVGATFKIKEIRIQFSVAVAANMTLTPQLVFDDDISGATSLTAINNTNYSGLRKVTYKSQELNSYGGINNLMIRLLWTGTVALPVKFPIEVELDVYADE